MLVVGDIPMALQQERIQEPHDSFDSQGSEAHLGLGIVCDRDSCPGMPAGMDNWIPVDSIYRIPISVDRLEEEGAVLDD